MIACDVGQGGAQLIRAAPGRAILVDTGPDPDALRACLASAGVSRISVLVLTHSHADHVGGLPAIAGEIPVEMVLVGSDAPAASDLEGLPETTRTSAGDSIELGPLRWTTIAAGPSARASPLADGSSAGEDAGQNDASIVGLIETGELRILVTGDLEVAGQQAVVSSGADIRADVLAVPHHGSPRQDPDFIDAVHARIALVQVGENNGYGHPASSALTMLRGSGATVFRTDQQGAIAVSADGGSAVTQR